MRNNYSSGAPWEDIVGYSRAVRIDNIIEVTGTTSVKNGEIVHDGDPFQQAMRCFEIIEESIKKLGGSITDVIRTRMYVTNIRDWESVGMAHKAYFGSIKPATTLIEVSALIDSRLLVEIEASAVLQQ